MKKHFLIYIFCLFCVASLSAKDRRARSADSFYTLLSKAPYSIAMFYDKSKDNMRNEEIREQIKAIETMFRSLSKDPNYKEANLQFVRVDVARRNLDSVAQQYAITKFPTFMTFLGREPIAGQRVQGYAYRTRIQSLIDRSLKREMQQTLKEKEAQRKRELERARIRAYQRASWWPYYSGPYWYGGGYPYWRYGYGYRRPGFGFYFGV